MLVFDTTFMWEPFGLDSCEEVLGVLMKNEEITDYHHYKLYFLIVVWLVGISHEW